MWVLGRVMKMFQDCFGDDKINKYTKKILNFTLYMSVWYANYTLVKLLNKKIIILIRREWI